jgi:hypothetical protein
MMSFKTWCLRNLLDNGYFGDYLLNFFPYEGNFTRSKTLGGVEKYLIKEYGAMSPPLYFQNKKSLGIV